MHQSFITQKRLKLLLVIHSLGSACFCFSTKYIARSIKENGDRTNACACICPETQIQWMTVTPLKSNGKNHFNYLLTAIPEKGLYSDFVTDKKEDIYVLLMQDKT